MGRKRQKGKSGSGNDNRGVSKVPSISFDISDEADRTFLEAMNTLDLSQIPAKDLKKDESSHKPAAAPRSKPGAPTVTVDLHGCTLKEALEVVGNRISQLLTQGGVIHLRVITGKGRHSGSDGSVLAKEVHKYVLQRFHKSIQRIDSAPSDVMVGDLPIRGHFDVVLRGL